MKTIFNTALITFILASLMIHFYPKQEVMVVPDKIHHAEIVKAVPKPKPVLTEQQQISKTATAIVAIYRTLSVSQAKSVIKLVFNYSKQHKIDPYLVVGLIAAESGFRQNVVSDMGAGGFMQVMEVYHEDKVRGRNVFDPHVNIQVGVKILANCFKKYGSNQRALGCYNGTQSAKGIKAYSGKVLGKRDRITRLAML